MMLIFLLQKLPVTSVVLLCWLVSTSATNSPKWLLNSYKSYACRLEVKRELDHLRDELDEIENHQKHGFEMWEEYQSMAGERDVIFEREHWMQAKQIQRRMDEAFHQQIPRLKGELGKAEEKFAQVQLRTKAEIEKAFDSLRIKGVPCQIPLNYLMMSSVIQTDYPSKAALSFGEQCDQVSIDLPNHAPYPSADILPRSHLFQKLLLRWAGFLYQYFPIKLSCEEFKFVINESEFDIIKHLLLLSNERSSKCRQKWAQSGVLTKFMIQQLCPSKIGSQMHRDQIHEDDLDLDVLNAMVSPDFDQDLSRSSDGLFYRMLVMYALNKSGLPQSGSVRHILTNGLCLMTSKEKSQLYRMNQGSNFPDEFSEGSALFIHDAHNNDIHHRRRLFSSVEASKRIGEFQRMFDESKDILSEDEVISVELFQGVSDEMRWLRSKGIMNRHLKAFGGTIVAGFFLISLILHFPYLLQCVIAYVSWWVFRNVILDRILARRSS